MTSSPPTNATPLAGGRNIMVVMEDSWLFIYCDLSQDLGSSTSRKNTLIATTGGSKPLGATNAFLGLNVFCGMREGPKLTDDLTLKLHDTAVLGPCCTWRVTGHTLCIMIDFENVWGKVSTTGNSVILASSGGNKAVGETGILCGLNCYVPLGKKFLMDKMLTILGNAVVSVGDTVEINEGFSIQVESDTQATVHCAYEYTGATRRVAMLPVTLKGDVSLSLVINFSCKSFRVEGKSEQMKTEFVSLYPQWKNLLLRYGPNNNVKAGMGTTDFYLRFDPTRVAGRSFSGKSITVASSGGWCDVGNGICMMFNAHKPAPPINPEETREAVQKVLRSRRTEETISLSPMTVVADVLAVLNLGGNGLANVRRLVREVVVDYLKGLTPPDPYTVVKAAVDKVLGARKLEEVATLSLKTILAEVLSTLGAPNGEEEEDKMRAHVTKAVMEYLRDNVK